MSASSSRQSPVKEDNDERIRLQEGLKEEWKKLRVQAEWDECHQFYIGKCEGKPMPWTETLTMDEHLARPGCLQTE